MTISSFKNIIGFFFLISCTSLGAWPADTLLVESSTRKIDVVKNGWVLSTKENYTEHVAWIEINRFSKSTLANKVYVGFTANIFWVAFTIKNTTSQQLQAQLEVDNPQIDWLWLYEVNSADSIALISATGDKLLFSERMIRHRNFIFPVSFSAGEIKTFLIKIDKRNSSLNFPIYVWNERHFNEKVYHENLVFGIFFGFLLLCLIYAVLAFAFLQKAIYGWYAAWILGTGLYLFTALGFSFQYLYPQVLDFNSNFRIYLIVFIFFPLAKFSQAFLNLQTLEPLLHRLLNYILYFFAGIALISVFAFNFLAQNGVWVIPIINGTLIGGGLLILIAAIKTFSRQRITVAFYFAAFGFLLVSYFIMNLSEFGWFPEALSFNPVLAGSALEIFIFSVALTFQVKQVYEERNKLSGSLARQQKELLKAYVTGVEKERERISRELHDDIGSRLGSLKRFASGGENDMMQKQIDILCTDVRNMSHQLSPTAIKISGLRQLVLDLASSTKENSNLQVDVQFYDFPDVLPEEISHHLYRIVQEAIANTLKHAEATEMDIQFFNHQHELVITIDDNGKGFDAKLFSSGIGIQNMKARVESLNGKFEISSTAGHGTSILLKEIFIPH